MKETTAQCKIRFVAKCPECDKNNNLLHPDLEGYYNEFIDSPQQLKIETFTCEFCDTEFGFDSVDFV